MMMVIEMMMMMMNFMSAIMMKTMKTKVVTQQAAQKTRLSAHPIRIYVTRMNYDK